MRNRSPFSASQLKSLVDVDWQWRIRGISVVQMKGKEVMVGKNGLFFYLCLIKNKGKGWKFSLFPPSRFEEVFDRNTDQHDNYLSWDGKIMYSMVI